MQEIDKKCEYVGKSIGKIHRMSMIYFSKQFSRFNIGAGQCFFLLRIYEKPGITQEELSSIMSFDKGTTARALKKLEDNGYIERVRKNSDKRDYSIITTKKAENIRSQVYSIMNSWEKKLNSCFTPEEAEMFTNLLNKLENSNLI